MGKILSLVLGLALVAGVAWFAMTGGSMLKPRAEPPRQQLENVREAARNIEVMGQEQADKAAAGLPE